MKKIILLYLLFWNALSVAGNSAFPRTGVLPEHITVEDAVRISIAAHIPPCIGSSDSYPTFFHLSENNHITFVFVAYGYSPCPYIYDFTMFYDIGTLSAGDYTLQVYTVGGPLDIPQSINDPLGYPLGELLEFSVQGVAEPVSVPFLSAWAIGLLMVLMFLTVYGFRKTETRKHRA